MLGFHPGAGHSFAEVAREYRARGSGGNAEIRRRVRRHLWQEEGRGGAGSRSLPAGQGEGVEGDGAEEEAQEEIATQRWQHSLADSRLQIRWFARLIGNLQCEICNLKSLSPNSGLLCRVESTE